MFRFDVADEIEVGAVIHQFVGSLRLLVAFLFLFADVQQGHPRVSLAHHAFCVSAADDTVLVKNVGFAVYIQAYVQQQRFAAVDSGEQGRNGRTDYTFDLLDGIHATHHHCAGASGACKAVDLAFEQVIKTDHDA